MDYETLVGAEKAAIVILSLPEAQLRDFLGQLEDEEVEKALAAVSQMEEVPAKVQERVLDEFRQALTGNEASSVRAGRKRAISIAQGSLDKERATRILEHVDRDSKRIDWTLRSHRAPFIADRIGGEHPQTISLVLSQLPAERGAGVIEALPEELRADLVLRLAALETVSNEVIDELELGVSELFESSAGPSTRVGGAEAAAGMLNRVAKGDGAAILGVMEERDSDTALTIRKRMMTFEDLVRIDRPGFQALLREVSTDQLAIALKAASEEMKQKVFENLSSRAADQIKEEIEMLPPMRLAEVEEVQDALVETARKLEEDGQLTIWMGGGDEVLV